MNRSQCKKFAREVRILTAANNLLVGIDIYINHNQGKTKNLKRLAAHSKSRNNE